MRVPSRLAGSGQCGRRRAIWRTRPRGSPHRLLCMLAGPWRGPSPACQMARLPISYPQNHSTRAAPRRPTRCAHGPAGAGAAVPLPARPVPRLLGGQRVGAVRRGRQGARRRSWAAPRTCRLGTSQACPHASNPAPPVTHAQHSVPRMDVDKHPCMSLGSRAERCARRRTRRPASWRRYPPPAPRFTPSSSPHCRQAATNV